MSDRLTVESPPIAPVYRQAKCNAPISFGQVVFQYSVGDKTFSEKANAILSFIPNSRLAFVCPMEDKPPLIGAEIFYSDAATKTFVLAERGVSFEGHCVAAGREYGGLVFSPAKSGIVVTQPSNALVSAKFHLFNFPATHGPDDYILNTGTPPLQGSCLCGRVILKTDEWTVTIAATEGTREAVKALKAEGGYVLTHVGEIVRNDGSAFSSNQLEDLLMCLQYFLSFCLGRWAGVALPVGFDKDGNTVFEQWGLRISADNAWNASCSWFDEMHAEWLTEIFPGFQRLFSNQLWRTQLSHALYWYLGACDRGVGIGVDTGMILAQTALEGLAWTYCVQDRKMVSENAFKPRGLSAADKVRLMATAMGISTSIPAELTALNGKPGKKWIDGADAITGIRNSLVHPHENETLPKGSYYEGWMLSLWFIDLAILRLCDHQGKYSNRLLKMHSRGVMKVPWAD